MALNNRDSWAKKNFAETRPESQVAVAEPEPIIREPSDDIVSAETPCEVPAEQEESRIESVAVSATAKGQVINGDYAAYNADCCEILPTLPTGSVHLSLYSPPFGGLYQYSSSERDLSNSRTYAEFMEHYSFVVKELTRVTMPGRISAVHVMDVPENGANCCGLIDFAGDVIKLHQANGWDYVNRIAIWKDPFKVRLRTMAKHLAHRQSVDDSTLCSVASPDYLIQFRKRGTNPIPVTHPHGFERYVGAREVPSDRMLYKGWTGDQKENRYSHWIWRQYASPFWDDIRIDRVLPYKESKEPEDEKHVHPLQLDVIERSVQLWSNPGEIVLTPFMGVGSEAFGAVLNGRRAIGIELKTAYYRQALQNLEIGLRDAYSGRQRSFLDDLDGPEPVVLAGEME